MDLIIIWLPYQYIIQYTLHMSLRLLLWITTRIRLYVTIKVKFALIKYSASICHHKMIVQKISSIKPARQDGVVDLLENCRAVANMSFTLSFPYSYACILMYSCSYLLGVCGAFELAHCEFSSCNYFPEWRLSVTLTFSTVLTEDIRSIKINPLIATKT